MFTNATAKGNYAEALLIAALVRQEYSVFVPINDGGRTDVIFDTGSGLQRVQVKTARIMHNNSVLVFNVCSISRTGTKQRTTYHGQVEYIGAVHLDTRRTFLVPIDDIQSNTEVYLRLTPTKNGQTRGVLWAKDYEI